MVKFPAAAQVATMQSFCNLVQRQKFVVPSGIGVFGTSRVLSSGLAHRLKHLRSLSYFSKSSFHSGAGGWTEELRGLSTFNDAMESSTSSEGEEPIGREAKEATMRRVNCSVDSSGGETVHKILTYFDPLQEKIMTSAAAATEESGGEDVDKVLTYFDPLQEKIMTSGAAATEEGDDDARARGQVEHSRVVEAVEKNTSGPLRKVGVRPTLGTEESEVISKYSGVVKKSGKVKIYWVCESCGADYAQWWGTCQSCKAVGSVKQFSESKVSKVKGAGISEAVVKLWLPEKSRTSVPVSLADLNNREDQSKWRIPLSGLFGMEVSRVLGGGLVPGSLVLIGGDPGIGKSTLLLQIAAILAEGAKGTAPIIYVSGEESIEQIANRANRMRITTKELFLYSSTDIEDILDYSQKLSPRALIVDSVQTVYLKGVVGSAGNISQVKECTSTLLRFAKQTNIAVLLIGHVTKTGDLAGPRMLEHIVDAVLYMEGERHSSYRLLRSVKNRFGSTDELGVFEMSESGLQAVSNPSELFLTENFSSSDILAGLAVAVIIDGSRAFLIEVQALCVSGSTSAKKHINGLRDSRADMIISVLMKQAGLKLEENNIFLNVVSGFELTETAGDLAVAAAICSSFLEFPIPTNYAFIGEIGLGGELRAVPRMDKRLLAVAKLGFKKCFIPKTAEKSLKALGLSMEIVCCKDLKELIGTVFQPAG